jgi:polyhydroxyalkanoate synthesis regulator phasin
VQPQDLPSPHFEEAEQLKRDLAAAREEVAELENRLKELENEKS